MQLMKRFHYYPYEKDLFLIFLHSETFIFAKNPFIIHN